MPSVHDLISRLADDMDLEGLAGDIASWREIEAFAGLRADDLELRTAPGKPSETPT